MNLSRRTLLAGGACALTSLLLPRRLFAQTKPAGTWLLFTKSSGFIHDVIKPRDGKGSFLHEHLAPVFAQRGIDLIESKDGRLFESDSIKRFSGFVFYTTGDLTTAGKDEQPPMSPKGKSTFLDAISAGTPFIGLHSATDSFRDPVDGYPDPFTRMIGARFSAHGDQQKAKVSVVDPSFPGAAFSDGDSFELHEEWYAWDTIVSDLHPIHVLETEGMKGGMYGGKPYPITWTRRHSKGRVFYTALGHREDVVASASYQRLIGGAVDWCRQG